MKLAQIPVSLFAATGLIGGIISQYLIFESANHAPYALAAGIYSPLCWHIYTTPRTTIVKYAAVAGLFFLLGAWRSSYQVHQHMRAWQLVDPAQHELIGIIQDIGQTNIAKQLLYRIHITHQARNNGSLWQPIDMTLYVYSKEVKRIQVGDTIKLPAIKLHQKNPSEYDQYLIKEGINSSLFKDLSESTTIHHPTFCMTRWLHTTRNYFFNAMITKMSSPTATLFASLFCGQTKVNFYESTQWAYLFRAWGLSHYLARSGLHLALFIYIWIMLLRHIPCAFFFKQLLPFILTLIYGLLSWSSTAFYRALITFGLYTWATVHKRRTNFLHILALVCIITLTYNPINLLFLDFELSYGLTLALGWFNYQNKHDTNGR